MVFGAAAVLASAYAWPVLRHFTSQLWGDNGDAWQNWWNGWWFGEALSRGRSPFDCDLLWAPDGANLWLHTLGPFNAGITALGQRLLPGFSGYNLLVFAHLVFGVIGAALLVDHFLSATGAKGWPRVAAAFLGGCAFGFSPYVWAHVSTHLHLSSVGFVPLFVLGLEWLRVGRGPERRPAVWAGSLLAVSMALLTALCGWYLLVDEAFIGGAYGVAALLRLRRDGWRPVGRLALVGLGVALLCGPLIYPVLAASREPLGGTHNASVFSNDLLASFVPSARLWIGAPFWGLTGHFRGNAAENGTYLGMVPLFLLGLMLWRRRFWRARTQGTPGALLPWPLLGAGAFALLLSFGPELLWLGRPLGHSFGHGGLVYRGLVALLPPLAGLGCPVRFALVTTLALAVVVGLGLQRLWTRAAGSRRGQALVALLGALSLLEFAPSGQPTTAFQAPTFLKTLAASAPGAAIVDLTGWSEPLYHQTLHHHPIVHGYTSRRPLRLVRAVESDPVVGALYQKALWHRAPPSLALSRLEFLPAGDFGLGAPDPQVAADFEAEWQGQLLVPSGGRWHFWLGSDDGSALFIDGKQRINNSGRHAFAWKDTELELGEGPHRLRLHFTDEGAEAKLKLLWQGPGVPKQALPPGAQRSFKGEPGWQVRYWQRVPRPRLIGAAGRVHLRERFGVGYLLGWDEPMIRQAAQLLQLPLIGEGQGLLLYRVPPA